MADISIASEKARLNDGTLSLFSLSTLIRQSVDTLLTALSGHARLGVAAGDHAVAIWPLLCGMAKAKYFLFTNDFLDGKEAERIGLVSVYLLAFPLFDLPTTTKTTRWWSSMRT